MAKPMKNHFLVQCGGSKKLTKKFTTSKTAAKAALTAAAKPRGPRICIVRPAKVQCSKRAGGKCAKKKIALMDPVFAAMRTAHGVKGTWHVSTRRG
jgi:hypothetical protein